MSGARGKAENFLRHLEPLQGALEAYCRRSVHDPNSVRDVIQSAVANAYRDFHRYAEGTNFRAWVFRYLHLEILNYNRKHQRERHEELPADVSVEETWKLPPDLPLLATLLDDPDEVLDRCDDLLAEAVRDLAPLSRAAFLLRSLGDFKYREIAEILQIPLGTVMTSLARSRSRLRERLVRFGEEQGLLRKGGRRKDEG